MSQNKYSGFSDEQLLLEQKKLKSTNLINAILIGAAIAVAAYSFYNKGFSFFTLFPLLFVYWFWSSKKNTQELEAEIKSRNL